MHNESADVSRDCGFGADAISCLVRAHNLASQRTHRTLLYAALELRFGIEARLHEFRDANKVQGYF
ncbi:hypothetical protein BN2475_340044 [Paraburkholderia ribeironis]|uniref:Uncharacterized protein n=1 Tax=Paraburkholderia ribeironis TaxID=1247936 RepID=A0A1N7S3M6_9BURK|nr:hypothetical protein BN2475_340044 [Paraburkholderia ribeironis]